MLPIAAKNTLRLLQRVHKLVYICIHAHYFKIKYMIKYNALLCMKTCLFLDFLLCLRINPTIAYNNNNNIFILYSGKSIYSSKHFTIKMYNIASVKLIRDVKFIINIQVKNYATCS